MITSRRHAIIEVFRRAERGDDRLALVDGWHLLQDAAAAGVPIEVVATAGAPTAPAAAALLQLLATRGTRVHTVSARVLDALSPVRTPSGVVALIERRAAPLDVAIQPPPALVVVAVDMQDPGNVGALVRSADAGGATGVALTGRSADPWGWKALRAAMGSTFRLPVARAPGVHETTGWLHAAGLSLVATVPHSGVPPDRIDWSRPTALLIGGEGAGLDPDVLAAADVRVSIPMRPPVDSLNVAVTAALLVYEARRQRIGGGLYGA